jgi:rod shape-determining protein MreC
MYQNRKSKWNNVVFVILILICFCFIICRFSVPVILIKNFVYYVAYPSLETANFIFNSSEKFADNFKSIVCLRQKNIAYKFENQKLTDKLRNYDIILQEYNNLSKLLKLAKIQNTTSVFAKISVKEPNERYQWLIIDKGKEDGLYNELPVTIFNKNMNLLCAMGSIIETYKHSSKVVLITNPIHSLPVEIKNKGVKCLAEGFGYNLLKVTYIASGVDVQQGDEVVVSELSSVFQKGMPVGVIKKVIKEKPSLDFKTAIATVFFYNNTLDDVVILVPKKAIE